MQRFYICIVLLISTFALSAQEAENETSISMQIRPRAEYRNGALIPRDSGALATGFVTNRARLSLEYKRSNLMMKAAAQHVGVWGQDPQIDRNGRFILNEAWAKFYMHKYFYAQLGRQPLAYDDERILGALDWNVAGRFHDALKLGYEQNRNKLHLILAFNQNDENIIGGTYYAPGAQLYKAMQAFWYHYAASNFSISALFLNLGLEGGNNTNPDTRYLQTFGLNAQYTNNMLKIIGSAYAQTGKTGADVPVTAWMASLKATYIINKLHLTAGTDYLSGIGTGDTKHKAFNPLYGTHHKFYGTMDYFYASSFRPGLNPGLWDKFAEVKFFPSKSISVSLTYHHFSMAKNVEVDGEKIKKSLGSEFDFEFSWDIMKDVKMVGGYSFMLGTKSMDAVKGGNHKSWQDWGWLSLNINPRVFFAKW